MGLSSSGLEDEVESVKAEMRTEIEGKDKQLKILQQTLQGMQQQLLEAQTKLGSLPAFLLPEKGKGSKDGDDKRREVKKNTEMKLQEKNSHDGSGPQKASIEAARSTIDSLVEAAVESSSKSKEITLVDITEDHADEASANPAAKTAAVATKTAAVAANTAAMAPVIESKASSAAARANPVQVGNRDARLLSIVATFLNVHPFVAGIDYIWSYLLRVEPGLKHGDVEELLSRYPECFAVSVDGIGAGLTRKWRMIAFDSV